MSREIERGLERADKELRAAGALMREDFPAQALSRGYFACFHAAVVALLALEQTRSKHSGVVSAFGRYVVKDGGMDPEMGETFRWLFDSRNRADYRYIEPPPEEAERAIADAERFVDAVRGWLANRGE